MNALAGYRVVATTRLGFYGWPGLDIQLVAGSDQDKPTSAGTLRLVLVNNMLYSVLAVSDADLGYKERTAHVLDSFQFIKPVQLPADR